MAGLATAPFAAFHFNRTAPLSLLANLAAMPLFSMLVMPMALMGVLAMPFGLEAIPLAVMEWGLDRVIAVAETVADWTGTSGLVPSAPPLALLAIALGLIWLCLWRQRWRLLGVPLMLAGVVIAGAVESPDVIIDDAADAVAVRGPDGRYSMLGANAEFEIEAWLRADADPRLASDETIGEGVFCDPFGCTAALADGAWRVALSSATHALAEDCRMAAVVVTELTAPADCGALVIDAQAFALGGAHALYVVGTAEDGRPRFRIVTARPELRRPWMPPVPDR